MNEFGNFVAFRRDVIKETTWYTNKNKTLSFLMFALITDAKYRNGAWHGIEVKRGDVVLGISHYANALGMDRSTLAYNLKELEKLGAIKLETKKGFNGYTRVSVLHYDDYVMKPSGKEKPKENEKAEDDGWLYGGG